MDEWKPEKPAPKVGDVILDKQLKVYAVWKIVGSEFGHVVHAANAEERVFILWGVEMENIEGVSGLHVSDVAPDRGRVPQLLE